MRIAVLDGHTLFQQLSLLEDGFVDLRHLVCRHSNRGSDDIAEVLLVVAPFTSFQVADGGRIHCNLFCLQAVLLQEPLDFVCLSVDALIEQWQVVARHLGAYAPRHFVCRHLALCQSLYRYLSVLVGEVVNTGFDKPTHAQDAHGNEGRCDNPILFHMLQSLCFAWQRYNFFRNIIRLFRNFFENLPSKSS